MWASTPTKLVRTASEVLNCYIFRGKSPEKPKRFFWSALRGPGDFFGSRQHGLPLFKVASLQMDLETLQDAQQAAAAVIQTADSLNAPELAPLKARVEALFTRQEVSLN